MVGTRSTTARGRSQSRDGDAPPPAPADDLATDAAPTGSTAPTVAPSSSRTATATEATLTSGFTTTTTEEETGTDQRQAPDDRIERSTIRGNKSTKSQRARRIALAKEEVARLKLELAIVRLAVIDPSEWSEGDDVRSVSIKSTERRVDTGLDKSQRLLAISNEPQHQPEHREVEPNCNAAPVAAPYPSVATHPVVLLGATSKTPMTQQQSKVDNDEGNKGIPQHSVQGNKGIPQRPEAQMPTGIEAAITPYSAQQKIDFSELASAITIAVKAGQRAMPSRYRFELPAFTGAHQDWLSFRTAYFESATDFSETENMTRLRRALKGRAKEAVESLLINSANPTEVMKILESRFGRPDSIALAEMDRLRNLPRFTDSSKDLCILSSKVTNIVATLRALNKTTYLYNPELTKVTIDKLTPTLRYRWFDFSAMQPKEEADLLKLTRFLEREVELWAPYAQVEVIPSTSHTEPASRNPYKRTQRTLNANANVDRKPYRCCICEREGHSPPDCDKFRDADINQRWDLAKTHRLCFRCLRYRNKTHNCKPPECGVNECPYRHHHLLHYEKQRNTSDRTDKTEKVTSTWLPVQSQTYLKVLPVQISGPAGEVNTHALLDDGSTVTLIDADLANTVGAYGPCQPMHIEAIGGAEVPASTSQRIAITIKGATQPHKIYARTIDNLRLSTQTVADEDLDDCQHLIDIQDALKFVEAKPKILVGQDNWNLLLASEVRKGKKNQPIASHTPLGWVLHGAHTRSLGKRIDFVHHFTMEESMDAQLKHHFAIEALTITPKKPQTDPEQRALKILDECTTRTEDGQYQTALLWKNDNIAMPCNYDNAMKRLITTEKKIDRNPELKEKYEQQMTALIEKGYAEPAPLAKTINKTWYLPHFAVVNPMKPGKIRIVHDAAAETKGVSLNDHLLTGPDLLQSLPGVMMRFRQHPIAVSADIAEMFMQVKIRPEDRDALRYLWRGKRRHGEPEEYRMTSLIFGATSSPSTAIYIKDHNASRFKETHPEATAAIVNNHYVDDYLDSFQTIEDAVKTASEVRDIHKQGHFELRQWTSNSSKVLEALDDNATPQSVIDLSDGTRTERVLGLIWKPGSDELAFNLDLARIPPAILNSAAPTKREALKIVMSLFDPLGLASPVTVRAKQILQEVWRRGTEWDQTLDPDLALQWLDWMGHLKSLKQVALPRCYLNYSNATSLQLHVFVDASETAYAATLYWRAVTPEGLVKISLIIAKSRVAPLKLTSIPRLELQAAVMGSRMAATVIDEHPRKPESKTFWSDSKTVLTWLKTGSRSYRPFVAHRIAAIEEHSTLNEWRWVPTKLNVADDATRDVPLHFNGQHRWYQGPEFLMDDPSTWPTEKPTQKELTGEEKTLNITEKREKTKLSHVVPDGARFSKWERYLRATARVLQFINMCRRTKQRAHYKRTLKNTEADPDWRRKQKASKPRPTVAKPDATARRFVPLDAILLREAEKLLVRASQEESFPTEMEDLKNNRAVSTSSRLRPISVALVDGIILLRSRIGATKNVDGLEKSPPVLDGNHVTTKLWIEYTHRQLLHAGVEATINECRQYYWILRLRPVTKMMVHRCLPCRIRRNMPSQPATGNHPPCRLAHHVRPFTYTGLDYFGPMSVTVGRSRQKRYGALFTCLTTRAVHLELAASLTTDSAVMALRRMIARRGCPTEIWSDNGTNLRGADKELRQSIDAATEDEATKRMISWRFIPPGAPFMGGAWERLVRSVKTALSVILQEQHPPEEVLATLLVEAEYTVNSRPLTHVSTDPEDEETLTPNHFLLGGSARVPAPGTFNEKDLIGRTHWRASQHLADRFWARWVKEYLPDLQYRREPHGRGAEIKIGDVVLVADDNLPRNTWPRGIVEAIYPGADGIVRAVDVRTRSGTLRRPTKKLIILPTEPVVPQPEMSSSTP